MSVTAIPMKRTGRYKLPVMPENTILKAHGVGDIKAALAPDSRVATPFRVMGRNSSATDCTSSSAGTVIDVSAMNAILNVDTYAHTVTVQPGVRIGDLVNELAEHGLELGAGHDVMSRTVGGAVAGACPGPSFGDDGAFFASQVAGLRVITPAGKQIEVREDQENLLHAFRLSYGMLGIFTEIRLNVRPIRTFAVNHRRCSFEQFGAVAEKLANLDVGLKFFLMPYRDRVYLDIRRPSADATANHRIPWKVKDWGESTVLPNVVKSISRMVPMQGVRYRLIDEVSRITQGMVNNRLVTSGSNSTALGSGPTGNAATKNLHYSTWLFPAADFAIVVQAFRELCFKVQEESGFRCDLPAVGFRVGQDPSALLSPSFDEPMIALRAVTTQAKGWDDFAIDFGDFAQHWGGLPLFNQTREVAAEYPSKVFGSRLDFFRKIRRHFDPENRMMNPFLSQYFL